jgi:hypothetical protein
LHGSRFDAGYDYGYLLAVEIESVYTTFLGALLGNKTIDKALHLVLGKALDWQWKQYLSKQVPAEYLEEIAGIEAGAKARGFASVGKIISRVIVLANAPGDVKDFLLILKKELPFSLRGCSKPPKRLRPGPVRGMCSMFGVWGTRSAGGQLFAGRNLDWNQNTGINRWKLVTVYHPPGKISHAVLGYVGLWGALTGMSAAGLTVHEANLEEDEITFDGFPWLLRLRFIMENAHNAAGATALWQSTNNTVGFNHMIGSASDAATLLDGDISASPATVFETKCNYSAIFRADDPREEAATYAANGSAPVHIGFPLAEAVWRTNHGYDPVIRQHYMWSQDPHSWSNERYMMIHDAILAYEAAGVKIGLKEAVNITAVVGDKGRHPYLCEQNVDGTNVLSVAFAPHERVLAAAWERAEGSEWRPACCSSYLIMDMNRWF